MKLITIVDIRYITWTWKLW